MNIFIQSLYKVETWDDYNFHFRLYESKDWEEREIIRKEAQLLGFLNSNIYFDQFLLSLKIRNMLEKEILNKL